MPTDDCPACQHEAKLAKRRNRRSAGGEFVWIFFDVLTGRLGVLLLWFGLVAHLLVR